MAIVINIFTVLAAFIVTEGRSLLVPRCEDAKPIYHRDNFIDATKGVAIIAVVLIHVSGFVINLHPKDLWLIPINNLLRFAVGFFLIVSGALVSRSQTSSLSIQYLAPKIRRILIPFLVVSTVLLRGSPISEILKSYVTGKASPPFYFVVILFQLYLLYPYLSHLKQRKYFLIFSLLLSVASLFLPRPDIFSDIPLFGRYLFFFAYGMVHAGRIQEKRPAAPLLLLLTFITLHVWWSILFPEQGGNEQFIYTVSLFELCMIGRVKNFLSHSDGLSFLGRHSLWIFLLHYPILAYFF